MKAKYLLPILSTVFLWSCNKEKEQLESPTPENPSIELYSSTGVEVKTSFAKVMAKAVANPAIRQLLADKAELQFDKDYDVLYHQIKNEVVDGHTLDSYIKELSSESDYSLFNRTPLLTIFIPHISQNKGKNAQTPLIAVRDRNNKLVAYNTSGEIQELNEEILPQFPVMVIKENERVVYENYAKKVTLKGRFIFESGGDRYFFANDEFEGALGNKHTSPSQNRILPLSAVDPEVQTAYNNGLTCNNCPQRDWVYYGIYPAGGANQGSLNIKYAEAITSVQFENTNVFSTVGGWDEGNYELYVSIFFGGASTGVFSSVLKVISVTPNDMFEFDGSNRPTAAKTYLPANTYNIAPWDMQAHGNRWAFKVEEYDPEVKKNATYAHSSTFGTNFKADASVSFKIVKLGAEFGGSTTSMNSTNFTYETTDSNDVLGGAILTWTDPIMVNSRKISFTSFRIAEMGTITTGTTRLGVETIRVAP